MTSSSMPYEVRMLQIEISTQCNFECRMCLRTNANSTDTDASMELPQQCMDSVVFEKLARELFPTLDRIVLYGLGEPLMHPQFLSLLDISRRHLPEQARIEFTTNGSLLTPACLDAMRAYKLYRIIVSLDSPFIHKNSTLRQGFSPEVMDNLSHLRYESSYSLGTISQSIPLASICASHASLFSALQSMNENVPWCGNCIYSTQNCYYVGNNEGDCYGNQPGCNECLYSTEFVKCLFD